MATPIISISSDFSDESVGSSTPRVVLFSTIPNIIPHEGSTVARVTIVTSPAGVLDLIMYSSTDSDLSEGLSTPEHAPIRGKVASRSPSSSSPTHALPSTDIASPAPHRIIPAPPGVPYRPAILVLPGQEIPLGRPYRTHPDGVLRMLTASKRVHLFLTRIPANRKRFHSSSSSQLRKRHRASSYSSSSDSPAFTAVDSPAPYRFVDPHPVRTLRDRIFFYSLTSSSERPSHSPAPSPSAGPSRKRCRSPATSVPSATPIPGALSSVRTDLLPHCKRIRGFLAASSPEDGSEESMEVGLTEVGFEGDDEVEDEADSSVRGNVEIGVDRVIWPEIPADSLVPASDEGSREDFEIGLDVVIQELYDHMVDTRVQRFVDVKEEHRVQEIRVMADEREMTRMHERISVLEGSNMRLRGALAKEREQANSVWRRIWYIQDELR
ncbi:hypothetical protein Tco_0653415 [Tanacetum coccineum]|uniref:Uncharacterized protein n=1 Tax=Tanacetum coccineum TaxID=301880 RepID=A0ABQ4X0B4_9ASTR